MSEWRSVTDESLYNWLSEKETTAWIPILVLVGGFPEIAEATRNMGVIARTGNTEIVWLYNRWRKPSRVKEPTHWMPFPPLPEVKDE